MASQASLARVQELYVAYYGRPADQAGQEYWADRLEDEDESAIINAFGNSAEYDELSEGQGNATLVDNLYLQMFGRHADPEGLTYYTGVLESGEKSLAEIATTILNAASGVDRNEFNAKVEAAAEYTADFGSAEDYDDVAAKDVVENAEGGLYTPELTPAIEDYQGAQEAVSDYLQDTVASNETIAEALKGTDEPSDTQIETALNSAIRTEDAGGNLTGGAEYDVNQAGDNLTLSQDASVAAAQIAAQQKAYAEAVDSAEETVSETDGLQAAINSLQSAETRYESALKAEVKTDAAQDAEFAKFASLNGLTVNDFTINDDGTIEATGSGDAVVEENNGELTIADAYSDSEGVDALVSASQDQFDAEQAVSKQAEAATDAGKKVTELDDTTDSVSVKVTDAGSGEVNVSFTAAGDETSASKALVDAEANVEAFDEAVADYQELTDLQSQVGNLETAKSDASDAIEEQGVTLQTDKASAEDDLFIFDGEDNEITDFGNSGEDQLYIGDSFTAVELDLDSGDTLAGTDQGDANTLEVFFSDNGTGTTLSFEGKAFAGNNEGSDFDGSEVTLTGVTADQLSLDNGYVAVA